LFTRNRFAFEGKFFKTLNLSTGVELRYHTPYKADGFSPILGQFFLQNDTTINNLPDIAAYLQFRIRSLSMFLRAENLNTFQIGASNGFLNNNLAGPLNPTPGFFVRFGVYWGFVN
jgi:Putative porin